MGDLGLQRGQRQSGENHSKGVDALLFDLGGVVIKVDFDRAFDIWAKYSDTSIDTLISWFSFDFSYERHERGEIETSDYFASLRSTLGINISDAEFLEGWTAIYAGEIPGVREILRRLKDKVLLYALTNSNPTHQKVWSNDYAEILSLFSKVFVSSEMGKRKPEPEAFEAIAQTIGVPLKRILFFDDSDENVEGARAIGMQAARVRSVEELESNVAVFLT